MDLNTPELTRIFREELEQRAGRLVVGARALANDTLDPAWVPDLVRDAHTIKGSAGLLGYEVIREAAARLEEMWRLISEGHEPDFDIVMAMESAAGHLVASMSDQAGGQLPDLTERLVGGIEASRHEVKIAPVRRPEPGSLGGLLSSVSESLLGGATRVDTGDLYRLINRIVEVALDTDALADLALVSIEGSNPSVYRRSWREQLEKLSTSIGDIQDQAVALANVSFRDAAATFPQFVRYLGRRMGKDVRFEILGDDVQLDRQIVDLLREPLRHLLVNAIDHGIEFASERIAAGKPATGVVRVAARVVEEGVEVSVSDDGAGIDWDQVAEIAKEHSFPFVYSDLSPLLFQPGFSTTRETTDFSGNGEGLAVARDTVERVHGAVHIESMKDRGTTVTMTLPMSMVLQNVVVVSAGDQFWGFPEASVEASMPLSKAEINTTNGGRELHFESGAIPVVSLSAAVGTGADTDESELVIMNTRFGLVAVTVGELIDRRRVAVKHLAPILEGPGHVTGAALLGGGQVLVVIDPNFLGILARRRPRLVGRRPRILVVDDSAGVRQLLSATLNGAGFEVEVAGSAREAVMAMAEDDFDAMVVDYSMPRSNGVELVRAMRASEVRVPIVMVSGVATQEEKRAAWEVGVNAYLDKFDLRQGVLTSTLRRLIGIEDVGTA
ncbi:MAG TPA: response regulator [Acidimicrobiia bacterium]|nr:response regulator [Acidimicrobiia bacterium]